jgi:hypothetical protein
MSWLIENCVHVEYDARRQHDLLAELAAVVRSRGMPLSR